jgi:hypothetical protein
MIKIYKGIFLIALALMWHIAQGQQTAPIPDSLRIGADAVYRKHITNINLLSANKLTINRKIEVTVLNEKGRSHTDFSVSYDPDKPIKNMVAHLYDETGKKVKTFKGKDIKDYSLYSESTLFNDDRVKEIEVYSPKYPYTVEFEYSQDLNQFISIPSWYPQVGYRVGVEFSSFTLTYNDNTPVRYKLFNIKQPLVETPKPGVSSLLWKVEGLKPIEAESFSSKFFESTPSVLVVPECFAYKGTEGCFTSWESYGKWVSGLIKSQADFSDKKRLDVQELIKGIDDDKEKVRVIYKYMQDRTRYVSIQLGLGGYQPFPADQVESTGWGDCKALVNYTKWLLGLAGIKSHYCEIGVDDTQIMFDDFPSAGQTNHIVLGIPLATDTLWLECTSQHLPFGYLPYSIQRQKVLWVDESNGTGRIVKTPAPDAFYNSRKRLIEFEINPDGNAKGKMHTVVQGGEMEELFPEIWQPHKERERIINNKYSMAGFQLISFDYTLEEGENAKATENISMSIQKLASRTGNRLFVKANAFGGISGIPLKSKHRRSEIVLRHSYFHSDTVVFNIPDGYKLEYVPKQKTVSSNFGELNTQFISSDNNIRYIKDLKINRYRGPASEFNNFVDFLIEINRSDEQNLVLVKE